MTDTKIKLIKAQLIRLEQLQGSILKDQDGNVIKYDDLIEKISCKENFIKNLPFFINYLEPKANFMSDPVCSRFNRTVGCLTNNCPDCLFSIDTFPKIIKAMLIAPENNKNDEGFLKLLKNYFRRIFSPAYNIETEILELEANIRFLNREKSLDDSTLDIAYEKVRKTIGPVLIELLDEEIESAGLCLDTNLNFFSILSENSISLNLSDLDSEYNKIQREYDSKVVLRDTYIGRLAKISNIPDFIVPEAFGLE